MNLIAIDPGSNKCGLAWFKNGKLMATKTLTTMSADPLARRLDIASQLAVYQETADKIVSEEPLLLGRNNNGMQRLLGYIEYLTKGAVFFIHPQTIKKFTGSGNNDKLDMALAAGEMLDSEEEKEILAKAISDEKFDETDAVCVGLCYLKRSR